MFERNRNGRHGNHPHSGSRHRSEHRPEHRSEHRAEQRYGQQEDHGADHRDHHAHQGSSRFTSDDRTYSMNDRNYDPVYAQRNDRGGFSGDDRGHRFQGDSFIGSRGYQGQEDYPGSRQGRKGADTSQNAYRGPSPAGYHGEESRYDASWKQHPYAGRPGLGGGNSSDFDRSPASINTEGYRAYQDYETTDRSSSSSTRDRGHIGRGPKGYKRSDEKIHDEVCDLLTSHYDIDASEIEVEVKEGVVTLGGAVESRRIKRMAEDVVADMNGVQDVRNNLRVLSHDSRLLESAQTDLKTGYRSPNASTDSSLTNRSSKSSSASSSSSTTPTTRQ